MKLSGLSANVAIFDAYLPCHYKTSIAAYLFYTALEVYTRFGMVSERTMPKPANPDQSAALSNPDKSEDR